MVIRMSPTKCVPRLSLSLSIELYIPTNRKSKIFVIYSMSQNVHIKCVFFWAQLLSSLTIIKIKNKKHQPLRFPSTLMIYKKNDIINLFMTSFCKLSQISTNSENVRLFELHFVCPMLLANKTKKNSLFHFILQIDIIMEIGSDKLNAEVYWAVDLNGLEWFENW